MLVVEGPKGKLAVDDGGEGERTPVLLVPSLAGTAEQWSFQLEHLRPSRRAAALELRGHGSSESPFDGDFNIASMSGDIGAAADALGLERFVLAGHSAGAIVAAAYAGHHPQRVAALLLADPGGDPTLFPPEAVAEYLALLDSDDYQAAIEGYWDQILAGATPATREMVIGDLRGTPRATVVGVYRSMIAWSPLPDLRNYPGRMLSVVTPLGDQPNALHRLLPELPRRLVTGTSHWLQLDKPEEFNAILDEFLAGAG